MLLYYYCIIVLLLFGIGRLDRYRTQFRQHTVKFHTPDLWGAVQHGRIV